MLCPNVHPRVEQRNGLTCLRIERSLPVGFATIAVKTGQSQILKDILAAWQYVIHGKWIILPSLVCMAVLAQIVGALSNLILKSSRNLSRH